MNTDHTDHQSALIGNAVIDGDGILRPALITARHWSDGDIEIAIRPLHIPDACIIIDRADLAAINTLLRAQPAIPVDGHPDPDPAAPHIQFTPSDTPSYQLTEHWQRIDELTSGMIALEERLHTLSGVVRAQATEIADLRSRLARVADDGTAIGRVAARAANMESYYDAERDAAPVSSAESRLTELEEQFDALQEVVRVIYTQSPTAQQDQINTLLVRTSALAARLDAADARCSHMNDRRHDDDAELTRRLLIRDKRLTKLETNVRALIAQAAQ